MLNIKSADLRWCNRLPATLLIFFCLPFPVGAQIQNCPDGNCPRPARATVVAPQKRIAVQPNDKQGPPLDYLYESDGGTIVRTTGRDDMQRYDVLKEDGWRDWSWQDLKRRQVQFVSAQNRSAVGAAGRSQWPHGHGPTIPASSNCLDCHKTRSVKVGSGIDIAMLAKVGRVEAGLALGGHINASRSARTTRQPVKAVDCPKPNRPGNPPVVVQGPPGPAGPPGPRGPAGASGVVDYERIIRSVIDAMPRPSGPTEEQLTAIVERIIRTHQGDVQDMIDEAIDDKIPSQTEISNIAISVFNSRKEELRGKDGSTPAIDYDEISRRIKAPEPKPDPRIPEIVEAINKLQDHEYKIIVKDKDGNPLNRRDGTPNEITISYKKDGELVTIPVPVSAPK